MKTLKFLTLMLIAAISFNACQEDDDLEFVAQQQGDFEFTNTFLEQYVLSPESNTNNNIGVLFAWESADFDAPTTITYQVQNSIIGDFTDAANVGAATAENQMTLTIGELKAIAETAGYIAPSEGELHFRIRAFVGESSSTVETFSSIQTINILLPEASGGGSGITPSTWGVVGSGYNNWGAFTDAPFYTTATSGVIVSYVTLVDGEIKFRENNASDSDLGDNDANGSLEPGGANIAVTAGDYKITINLNDNTYTMEDFSWGVVGDGYNNWGETPDGKFYYDYTTDTFKVGILLLDGEIKFRKNSDWAENFGDTGADGTLDNGGDNLVVTAGHYNITLDFNNNTYTLEAGDVFGIVGDGYNNWGETPDFSLTQIQPDVYYGDIVTLLDGEIKFRLNSDWGTNYGDTGADGTIDNGGDNIVVTAGLYRVVMDVANGTYSLNKIQ
uniref:SusE domain-containing protein n=1 Tax=Gelidibacter sp. TaxID=2018083 RepID=UPI00404A08CD